MTLQEASQQLLFQLYHLYDAREAGNIADLVLEHLTGWKKIDRIINKKLVLSAATAKRLAEITHRLQTHEPVQYVLEEAWFGGMKFFVNKHVLIPRPETEELADWIINDLKNQGIVQPVIADIGTGTGCIAITIKKNLPGATVSAYDIDENALSVARKNSQQLNAEISLVKMDVLNDDQFHLVPECDVIVSNPPYIPFGQQLEMASNVTRFEPHLALFVPDNDALLFYRQLANLSLMRLKSGGMLYAELHEDHSTQAIDLLRNTGLKNAEVKKDLQEKPRMIRAVR